MEWLCPQCGSYEIGFTQTREADEAECIECGWWGYESDLTDTGHFIDRAELLKGDR